MCVCVCVCVAFYLFYYIYMKMKKYGWLVDFIADQPFQSHLTLNEVSLIKVSRPSYLQIGGARGAMVIVVGIVPGDTSSKPGRD